MIRVNAGALGLVAVVMVGAAGVGNIRLTHAPDSAVFLARAPASAAGSSSTGVRSDAATSSARSGSARRS